MKSTQITQTVCGWAPKSESITQTVRLMAHGALPIPTRRMCRDVHGKDCDAHKVKLKITEVKP